MTTFYFVYLLLSLIHSTKALHSLSFPTIIDDGGHTYIIPKYYGFLDSIQNEMCNLMNKLMILNKCIQL